MTYICVPHNQRLTCTVPAHISQPQVSPILSVSPFPQIRHGRRAIRRVELIECGGV
ncbi:hypothetical protein BJ165DRAFT_1492858 [Panaeolus papilionaceus]|nr:hypothetical protein BJ165DRAFT_1492858 [Panaeolus papilionaceus]